ncbi:MAG TPA: hypothetical protein VGQ26_11680 [Streptosporangiaceae bacterium]|nr:hypothetical protein [Streptosporangiaceae bacterium]
MRTSRQPPRPSSQGPSRAYRRRACRLAMVLASATRARNHAWAALTVSNPPW